MADTTVPVYNPVTGNTEDMAPAEAQAEFLAGRRQLLAGSKVPLVGGDGKTVADFDAAGVEQALKDGWQFAGAPQIHAADAQGHQLRAGAEGALAGLTFGASDLAMAGLGADRAELAARRATSGGELGEALGMGASMLAAFPVSGAGAAGGAAARGIMARSLEAALAPTRALEAVGAGVEAAGRTALGEALGTRIGLGAARAATEGTVVGALEGMSEEALGDPNANAQAILAAGGAGALLGGLVGGVAGAGLHGAGEWIGSRGGAAARAARPALPNAEQLAAELSANGLAVGADNSVLGRFTKLLREDLPASVGGFNVDDIRKINSPQAQEWLKLGKQVREDAGRKLANVIDLMAQAQTDASELTVRMRPDVVAAALPPVAGNAAVGLAARTLDDVRASFQGLIDSSAILGLGAENDVTRMLRKHVAALDAADEQIFKSAGIGRQYEARMESSASPGAEFAARAGREQTPGVALPAESLEGQLLRSVRSNDAKTVREAEQLGLELPRAPSPWSREGRAQQPGVDAPVPSPTAKALAKVRKAGLSDRAAEELTGNDALDDLIVKTKVRGKGTQPPLVQGELNLGGQQNAITTNLDVVGGQELEQRFLAAEAKHGELPIGDKAAVKTWSDGSTAIRKADRGDAFEGEHAARLAGASDNAKRLNALIDQRAEPFPVLYRGLALDSDTFAKVLKQGEIADTALASWTYNPDYARTFAGSDYPAVVRLTNAEAYPLGVRYAEVAPEWEALRKAQSYKIANVTKDPAGVYTIHVEPSGVPVPAAAAPPRAGQLTFDDLTPARKPLPPGVPDATPAPARNAGQLGFEDIAGQARAIEEPVGAAAARNADRASLGGLAGARETAEVRTRTLRDLAERYEVPQVTGRKTFEVLDQLRRVMDAAPKSASPEVREAFDRARSTLRDALEDESVFGKAAAMEREMSIAARAKDDAWAAMQKHFRFLEPGQVDPASLKAYLGKVERINGDAVASTLEQWMSAQSVYADAFEQFYGKGAGVGTRAAALQRQGTEAVKDLGEKAGVFNALQRLNEKRRQNLWHQSGTLSYALGGAAVAAGSVLGLPALAVGLPMAAAATMIADPGRAAIMRANAAITRDKVAKYVDGSVRNLVTGSKAVVPPPAGAARAVSRATTAMLAAKNGKDRREAWQERSQELAALSQPDAFASHVTAAKGDMAAHMPSHAQAIDTTAQTAVALLLQSMPNAMAGSNAWGRVPTPTDAALLKFALLDNAVQDPLGALANAQKRGYLTAEERQAIRTVYPALASQMAMAAMTAMQDAKSMPGSRLRLAQQLASMDPSVPPEASQIDGATLAAQQAVHAAGGPPGAGKPGPSPAPRKNMRSGLSDTDALGM